MTQDELRKRVEQMLTTAPERPSPPAPSRSKAGTRTAARDAAPSTSESKKKAPGAAGAMPPSPSKADDTQAQRVRPPYPWSRN